VIDTTVLSIGPARLVRLLRDGLRPEGIHPAPPQEFGPAGVAVPLLDRWSRAVGSVLVSQAEHARAEWLHASIAFAERMPTYEHLKLLKEATFGPSRVAYMVFPIADQHVNIHEYALHLWGKANGAAVLPDFTRGTGSI
jgi:hypothetical protein